MCGRTACTLAPGEVSRAARYRDREGSRRRPQWRDGDADKYRPSYNKSPQSFSPVLLSRSHFQKDAPTDECVLAAMRWGLVPSWFRESDPSKMQFSTSNCRGEGLLEKKSYKVPAPAAPPAPPGLEPERFTTRCVFVCQDPLLRGQRCVVLADGFYEWRRQEKDKQPFFIYFPQEQSSVSTSEDQKDGGGWTGWRLLTIAGLFDRWTPPSGGEVLYTYTVITVQASSDLQSIHDRMPAVLDGEEEVRRWLDFGEVPSLEALHLLTPKNCLTFHPVSPFVNNSRNDSAECIQPADTGHKKTPDTSASSRMMMKWLKRKEPEDLQQAEQATPPKRATPAGLIQRWLQGGKSP
ncbi:LOW QUALITY PROTEIN: embryonic stem cell-specific 5-hydroxymethylcytosine-binding protein-like [Denticeps clupeoides]|uniref:LOW QUALITY PROTEIN: embryonic stem cell-specific 5-hydroxymethylcytosine-binding protein-like n=1 Tax=Denticeps clupeoides TaxID=299321 RepID=UPI0010A4A161|nr:LOW QUALITY PROTEIN: embryonic stem cell-specific 5-hydroxymethylcytosine-binding protein-like [Denticeps clupeoides]